MDKHKLRKLDIDENWVKGTVMDRYTPYEVIRQRLYEYLEDCDAPDVQCDFCFKELLDRLCWMWEHGRWHLEWDALEELNSIFTQTMDTWDRWIDEQKAET